MQPLYDRIGGQAFFDALVDDFYARVDTDERLRSMYPDDLSDPKRHLALFLGQFWGGPTTYMDERGHPRMRLRHLPFVIDQGARDAWFEHMAAAVRASGADDDQQAEMLEYFERAATFLINA